MNSLEKIRDIKSLINEFYQGELSEGARKSWLVFQQYCDDIKQDLELLEQLKQQRDSLAINNGELCVKVTDLEKENQELKEEYENLDRNFHSCHLDYEDIEAENQKLKKVIEILKPHLRVQESTMLDNVYFIRFGHLGKEITKEQYELLKEVLEYE